MKEWQRGKRQVLPRPRVTMAQGRTGRQATGWHRGGLRVKRMGVRGGQKEHVAGGRQNEAHTLPRGERAASMG